MKELRIITNTDSDQVEPIRKAQSPAVKLLKSIRKPNREDSLELKVGSLDTDFPKADEYRIYNAIERPKTSDINSVTTARAKILDHKSPRLVAGHKSIGLRDQGFHVKSRSIDLHGLNRAGAHVAVKSEELSLKDKAVSHTYQIEPHNLMVNGQLLQDALKDNNFAEIDKAKVYKSTCNKMVRHGQKALTQSYFDHELRELAKSTGVDVKNIKWVGLFRFVPINMISSLVVDDKRSQLTLTLKENASIVASKKMTVTVNIAMGRHTGSGALLQTIIA